MRHTVGGAHSEVTGCVASASISAGAAKRGWLKMKTQACAFHGAKKQLHACLAQPGDEMFRCTSPGCNPSQYIVDRCPTG